MTKKAKKITFIILAVVLVLIIGIIILLNYVFPKMIIDHLFPQEEFTECYDGKYGYLQLSSPKKTKCTLNLYDMQAPRATPLTSKRYTHFTETGICAKSGGASIVMTYFLIPPNPHTFIGMTKKQNNG